jgi:hypothetical protein
LPIDHHTITTCDWSNKAWDEFWIGSPVKGRVPSLDPNWQPLIRPIPLGHNISRTCTRITVSRRWWVLRVRWTCVSCVDTLRCVADDSRSCPKSFVLGTRLLLFRK